MFNINELQSLLSENIDLNVNGIFHNYCKFNKFIRYNAICEHFKDYDHELKETDLICLINNSKLPFIQECDKDGIYWECCLDEDVTLDADDGTYTDEPDGNVIKPDKEDEIKNVEDEIDKWVQSYPINAVVKKIEAAASTNPEKREELIRKGKEKISKFIK